MREAVAEVDMVSRVARCGRGFCGIGRYLLLGAIAGAGTISASHSQDAPKLSIHWDKVTVVSKTTPTFQVVVNPPLRPGHALAAASYKAVKALGAEDVRYVPWLPYPRLAV